MAKLQIDGVDIAEMSPDHAAELLRHFGVADAVVLTAVHHPDFSVGGAGGQRDIAPVWREPRAAGETGIQIRWSIPNTEI